MTAGQRITNLRELVIRELLEQPEVCAALFARKIHAEPNSVSRVLRDLREHLTERPAPNEPGKRRVYFAAADRGALEAILNRGVLPSKTLGARETEYGFAALASVWGLAVRDIRLPVIARKRFEEHAGQDCAATND